VALMLNGNLASVAQSGPTYYNQAVFNWSGCEPQCSPHIGLPNQWQFADVLVSWVLNATTVY